MPAQTKLKTLPSSARPALDRARPEHTETALLALGCFWSPDALFGALPGVVATASGYAGGAKADPTYRALGNHTETVEVTFDLDELSYEDLLAVFFEHHDSTRRSWKRQYRSALFVLDEDQAATARRAKAERNEHVDAEVRTAVERVDRFHLAEGYHQNHRLRQFEAFERVYAERYPETADFARSTAASRVNGYLAGHGPSEQLKREIGTLGLPTEELQDELRRRHERGGRASIWQRLFGNAKQ